MAPPTANDPWLAGRHFGIVIDAGSSGSRLQIYSWRDPKLAKPKGRNVPMLPKIEKGTKDGEGWVMKIEPGLSTLVSNPASVGTYLTPLIKHAQSQIVPSLHASTPVFVLATAGMRLLTPPQQAAILAQACSFLRTNTRFRLDDPSEADGPCGSSVRIITGEEEGLFGWIAVNYLMNGFTGKLMWKGMDGSKSDGVGFPRTTYGFLDMGGASTQIAFEPSEEYVKSVQGKGLVDVRLRLLNGEEILHKVFVTTWLGYGTNQARERYVGQAVQDFEAKHALAKEDDALDVILDPCLPKGLELVEHPLYPSSSSGSSTSHSHHVSSHLKEAHKLFGTGSFESCMHKTAPLLNKAIPCPDAPCLMNGQHVPPIDFSASHFIGVSEYWYSSEHIFGLGGVYDFVQYERAASEFCARDWEGILKQHEESRRRHRLGGDGELVEENSGKVVGVGVWGPEVELPRLRMQCFKAAWIVNVLHEGLGMPRIVDPGGNGTVAKGDSEGRTWSSDNGGGNKVADEAQKKGLGKPPTFQSLDTVGDIAISWTLGKMVLEASKEVPPLTKGTRPLVDPVEDIEDYTESPVKPIRPFLASSLDMIELKLTPHLPSALTRESLGFSPVLFLFWMLIIFAFFLIAYPMRRQLKATYLRLTRGKKDAYGDLLEEGRLVNGNGTSWKTRPVSSPTSWIRRIASGFGASRTANGHSPIIMPHLRPKASIRPSSTRSSSLPTLSQSLSQSFMQNEYGQTTGSTRYSPTVSRAPSPPPGIEHDGLGQQTTLSPRSRNVSQVNLSSIAPHPTIAISRTNSTVFTHEHE